MTVDSALKDRVVTALQTLARTARAPEDAAEALAILDMMAEPVVSPDPFLLAAAVQAEAKESAEKVLAREFGAGAPPSRSAHLDVDGEEPYVPPAPADEEPKRRKK